jgi:RNA-binding protein Musashi
MNNYQAAAAQGYGPPTSPHATNTRTGFPAANSPGPTIDMYSSNGADSVSYVQATSPQPSGFPAIAVSRAPLNYSPVSDSLRCNCAGMAIKEFSLSQGPLIPAAFTNGYH